MVKIPLPDDFKDFLNDPIWSDIAAAICRIKRIPFKQLDRAPGTENVVFFVDDKFVIKIYTPLRNGFNREMSGLEFAAGKTSIRVPQICAAGDHEGYLYLVTTRFPGRMITRAEWLQTPNNVQVRLLQDLARGLYELHSGTPENIKFSWTDFICRQLESVMDRQKNSGARNEWLEELPGYLEENIHLLPRDPDIVFIHGDVHFGNLRIVEQDGKLVIAGMFDLSDSLTGFHEYEFVAPGVLMIQGQGALQKEFFRAYGYADDDIDEELRARLMLLTILYECSSLKRYAIRLRPEAINYSLNELERAIWNFI